MNEAKCPRCGMNGAEFLWELLETDFPDNGSCIITFDCTCLRCGERFILREFYKLKEQSINEGDWYEVEEG